MQVELTEKQKAAFLHQTQATSRGLVSQLCRHAETFLRMFREVSPTVACGVVLLTLFQLLALCSDRLVYILLES